MKSIAVVTLPGRKAVLAQAVDICEAGVCATLPAAVEVGRSCRLDLEIDEGEKRSKTVVARVCFCLKRNAGFRVGFSCALEGFARSLEAHR
jgi:hypothetical protein